MPYGYLVADVFTTERFAGNPAAVVLDAGGLAAEQMQAVAAEFNLSETTFVLPPQSGAADVRFRWFTPAVEVRMCGHATIAGVHAMLETQRWRPEGAEGEAVLRIETVSGVLEARRERIPSPAGADIIWLELLEPKLVDKVPPVTALSEALNLPQDAFVFSPPAARTQDDDLIVLVRDVVALNAARLDRGRLVTMCRLQGLRGLCVATVHTLTPAVAVQSRFFAPACGVDEDPVTGSVHGPLGAYLVRHGLVRVVDGKAGMLCVQGRAGARAGLVHVLVHGIADDAMRVRIGGQAVTVMSGNLLL
ncbi:MAG TPA: PhzF family phenazine biosynthesis protein [Phycisphaerae bacterium]|nr:PhzF family phenazine biosynthesis protein [Phycisphaerae bacterium]HNU46347.1 PhzF family phenazine biosynthesis protein [Phycisphaerae bacterium]